jgi:hypothetical protein
MAGRVLIVPSSQADSCAQAVRAFLYPIGPRVHAVQAKLAKPDGVVCNTALWTIGKPRALRNRRRNRCVDLH